MAKPTYSRDGDNLKITTTSEQSVPVSELTRKFAALEQLGDMHREALEKVTQELTEVGAHIEEAAKLGLDIPELEE